MASSDTLEFTWRVEQGEREQLVIPVLDDTAAANITGWTVDAQIKNRAGGDTLYTWPAGLAYVSASGTSVTITIPAAVSAAWVWRIGWWRVVITDPASDPDDPTVHRIIEGPLVIDPD